MSREPPVIAVTIGDPNGIGPEIAVKAAAAWADRSDARIVVIGDGFVVRHYAKRFGLRVCEARPGAAARCDTITLVDVQALPETAFRPGTVNAHAGRATVDYARVAVELARAGRISAIVGCPHSETAINSSGLAFSGYPNLIARFAEVPADHTFLMLIGGGLRIVHATLHERLQDALQRLTPDLIMRATETATASLRSLGIGEPRIGIFGINPHAGEGGLFGDDDLRITASAVERLKARGFDVSGPAGADTMLLQRDAFDAFVAMFHDQGHIAVKLVAGRHASALSIGAGVLFSSVGHGAAFDIAGRDKADPEAVMRAIELLSGLAPAASPTRPAG